MNTEDRKILIAEYLGGETEPQQEQMLAEWFASHKAEPGEEAVAALLLAEYPDAVYAGAEKEFDSIAATCRRRSRAMRWACWVAASAAVLAGVLFFVSRPVCDFNGLEIAQGIEQIMSLDMENVVSITARPDGKNVIITAEMTDGRTCSYLMSKDQGTSALTFTAMND